MEQIVYARTNAEFLNEAFGTNYKAWRKCGWDYDKDTIVWMIELDDKVRNGWKNTRVNEETVREDYVGRKEEKLDSHKKLKNYRRIIVKKNRENGIYIVLGLYAYDHENSVEENKRIWKKISDQIF